MITKTVVGLYGPKIYLLTSKYAVYMH